MLVQGVFVVDKDKRGKLRAKFVPVTTGITGATDIEVLSGLNAGSGNCDRALQDAAHFEERARRTRYRRPGQLRLRRGLGHGELKAAAPPRASKHQRMRTALRLKAARMPRQFRACGAGPAKLVRQEPLRQSRSGSASPKLAGHAGGFEP